MANEYTTVETGENTVGRKYALQRNNRSGTWCVLTRCANYAAHVVGGIAYAWRVDAQKLSEDEARALFAKRLKGKKPA